MTGSRSLYGFAALVLVSVVLVALRDDTLGKTSGAPRATVAPAPAEVTVPTVPLTVSSIFKAPVGVGKLTGFGRPIAGLMTGTAALGLLHAPYSPSELRSLPPLPDHVLRELDTETLWLARCIYSETKRPEEQELVAWVVRNRVETQYRGKTTYKDVVLDPFQFSAFNEGSPHRTFYSNLTPLSRLSGWQRALRIAFEVRRMPSSLRPFSIETRHFYSEQSMKGRRHPVWSHRLQPVFPLREFRLESHRFRFFERVP